MRQGVCVIRNAKRGAYPPANMSKFGTFARKADERYGPTGTLWAEHPITRSVPSSLLFLSSV